MAMTADPTEIPFEVIDGPGDLVTIKLGPFLSLSYSLAAWRQGLVRMERGVERLAASREDGERRERLAAEPPGCERRTPCHRPHHPRRTLEVLLTSLSDVVVCGRLPQPGSVSINCPPTEPAPSGGDPQRPPGTHLGAATRPGNQTRDLAG